MLLVSVLIMLLAFISSFYEFTSHQLQLSLAAPYNHSTFFLAPKQNQEIFFSDYIKSMMVLETTCTL